MSDEFKKYVYGDTEDAADLLASFRDNLRLKKINAEDRIVEISFPTPVVSLEVGRLVAVAYEVDGQKEPFFHRFQKNNRPILFVSSDGKQIFVAHGSYRFTDRGFMR
jgi:hypothetical protein